MGPESTRSHDFDRLFGMPLYETCHGADRERLRSEQAWASYQALSAFGDVSKCSSLMPGFLDDAWGQVHAVLADEALARAQVFAKNDMDAKLLDCCCVLHRWQEALLLQGAAAVAGLPIHVPTSPGPRRPYAPARVV